MAAPKRKQDKASYPVASKKPKFGKESNKPKKSTAGKKYSKTKTKTPVTIAKPSPKRTALSVESDSDELDDGDAFEEIKDDGSEDEKEGEGDEMDIEETPKGNSEGGTGCE